MPSLKLRYNRTSDSTDPPPPPATTHIETPLGSKESPTTIHYAPRLYAGIRAGLWALIG